MFREIRAVLFDLDGTLVDSAPDLGAAADKMRSDRGLSPLPLSSYRPMAGAGARGMLAQAFGITPDHPEFDALREEFFSNYEARLTQTTHVFEGIHDLIEQLTGMGLVWGVVTNKASRFSEPLTRSMPLFVTSKVLISGDTTPHAKPHPAPLLEAASRIGISPAHCLYVGDDHRDIVAGKAAHMGTVAALYGYLGEQANHHAWGADAAIASPVDLLDLICKD